MIHFYSFKQFLIEVEEDLKREEGEGEQRGVAV